MPSPTTVDAYFGALPPDQRILLESVRARIHRLLPAAQEAMSYGMPAFTVGGKKVVWIAGWKRHCSVYPLTDSFLAAHADELRAFDQTKGSVHFTPDAPLPEALLDALVTARLADVEGDDE